MYEDWTHIYKISWENDWDVCNDGKSVEQLWWLMGFIRNPNIKRLLVECLKCSNEKDGFICALIN